MCLTRFTSWVYIATPLTSTLSKAKDGVKQIHQGKTMTNKQSMTKWERRLLGVTTMALGLSMIGAFWGKVAQAQTSLVCLGGCHQVTHCASSIDRTAIAYPIKCCKGTGTGNFIHDCMVDTYDYYDWQTVTLPGSSTPTIAGPCTYHMGTCQVVYSCTISTPKTKC
jgi:hypothetical protein